MAGGALYALSFQLVEADRGRGVSVEMLDLIILWGPVDIHGL